MHSSREDRVVEVTLYYDFSDEHYREGKEVVSIHKPWFKYKVNISWQENLYSTPKELMAKYKERALEEAAYQTMCEYADSVF